MKCLVPIIVANVICLFMSLSGSSIRAQNVIDDKLWGWTYDSEFDWVGTPGTTDSYYMVVSDLFSLGPDKYKWTNPKMFLVQDSCMYAFGVRFVFNEAPWKQHLEVGSTLKLISASGDTTVLQKHPFAYIVKFRWMNRPLRGVGWGGASMVKGYCVNLLYAIPDIDKLLSSVYVGFDVADGFYIQDFSDNAKRIKSFNKCLKSAKRNVDRRVKATMFKRTAYSYPSDY